MDIIITILLTILVTLPIWFMAVASWVLRGNPWEFLTYGTVKQEPPYISINEQLPEDGSQVYIKIKGREGRAVAHFDRWFCHPKTGLEPRSTKNIIAWRYM